MLRRLLLLPLPLLVVACAAGAPPPGPIDVVREIFDPDYDYTESPSTWDDEDEREAYLRDRDVDGWEDRRSDGWRDACPRGDLACSHEGVTVCCAPYDRCCAGVDGPYCCEGHSSGYERDDGWPLD